MLSVRGKWQAVGHEAIGPLALTFKMTKRDSLLAPLQCSPHPLWVYDRQRGVLPLTRTCLNLRVVTISVVGLVTMFRAHC